MWWGCRGESNRRFCKVHLSQALKHEEEFSNQTGREEHSRPGGKTNTGHKKVKRLHVIRREAEI